LALYTSPPFAIILRFVCRPNRGPEDFAKRQSEMARTIGRLTALGVEKVKASGLYPDGDGLYLRVTNAGTKNWVLRFMLNRRPRWMGLGPVNPLWLARSACKGSGRAKAPA
jgi:hypothetical protein